MGNKERFFGFTTIDRACIIIVLLLVFLVIGGLPYYSIRGVSSYHVRWSSEGDRISSRAIERLAQKKFTEWASNPLVIEAVREANTKPARSLDEIIALDEGWIKGEDQELAGQFIQNECSRYLRQLQNAGFVERRTYAEIFVMDRQGCLVALSERTTDFWQGDEDKFIEAFAEGKGKIFIDGAAYDESSGSPLIQVSVPVLDPDTGEVIGVMTIGLNIGALAEQI